MAEEANFVLLVTALTVVLCNGFAKDSSPPNNRPIIGVLTQETNGELKAIGDSYIYSAYIKDLEEGGARIVPIRIFQPTAYYVDLFKKINGVFFPGGDADLFTSGYSKAGKILFELALQANAAGDYFPVWGTCLGFELLSALVANRNVMGTFDAVNIPLPLNLIYPNYVHSKLFGNASEKIIHSLMTENVTANYHTQGLSPEVYYNDKSLSTFFQILSTNVDRNGKAFVSSIEGREFPVFGVQFHPEKNTFIWSTKYKWLHTENAIKVTQYFADFLVDQARYNHHSFPNEESAASVVIENYRPVYLKMEYPFESAYFFNFTHNQNLNWFKVV